MRYKYPSFQVHAYVPSQDYHITPYIKNNLKDYFDILDAVDRVVFLSDKFDQNLLEKRNRAMIDKSDALYALLSKKPVILFNPHQVLIDYLQIL